MLPHLRDRRVTLQRFPDRIQEEGFYQKEIPDHFPDWIRRVTVPKEGGEVTHVLCPNRGAGPTVLGARVLTVRVAACRLGVV